MPRSPSRDLSDRYIGRRGYFRTPDAIRRGKYVFAVIALFAAVAWAAVDVAGPARTAYGHSHGPLTNPHAAFDDNCSACHATYGLKDATPLNVLNARERWHNLTCEKCHGGPPHHATATKKGADRHLVCSNCHHDHQGRSFSLVRLNDRDCNVCHESLDEWRDPAKIAELTEKARTTGDHGYDGPYAAKVTHFVNDHPTFRSLEGTEGESKGPPKNKPRTLTFSHAVHMNPGQAYGPDGKEAMTVRKLRELAGDKADAAVAKYAPGATDEGAKVQLNCASCHVLDAGQGDATYEARKAALAGGDPARSILPPRAEGAYFLPTNFESHCRSCHPLAAVEGTVAKGDDKLLLPRFDLPHRKPTGEVRALLKAGYVKALIAAGELEKLPKAQGPGLPADALPDEFRTKVDQLTERAERLLLNGRDGCAKCHVTKPEGRAGGGHTFAIQPVPDRTVWFTHAKFNHAAHRGATCAACHPGTGARAVSPQDAEKPEPVQILGRDSCRTCHSPTSSKVEVFDAEGKKVERPGGGIRSNCTDCHRYHHGDQPLQGRGADSWFPKQPRDLADWLKGK